MMDSESGGEDARRSGQSLRPSVPDVGDLPGYTFEQQDQEWEKVDARVVMDKEHSSAGGWRQVSAWLQQQGALGPGGPAQGGASGCVP